ncbi:serine/arginine repetitive matrix protein 1-like [Crotalus tigris]|uniref:serine/arginine repetitive matrix protein 1-like n=1 Tax=Crotalus tigris TaxID=88082 RepID=UPI00192F5782|nr:serine/arginine repetitive matrix protein 1-like [Crotalus tigris]
MGGEKGGGVRGCSRRSGPPLRLAPFGKPPHYSPPPLPFRSLGRGGRLGSGSRSFAPKGDLQSRARRRSSRAGKEMQQVRSQTPRLCSGLSPRPPPSPAGLAERFLPGAAPTPARLLSRPEPEPKQAGRRPGKRPGRGGGRRAQEPGTSPAAPFPTLSQQEPPLRRHPRRQAKPPPRLFPFPPARPAPERRRRPLPLQEAPSPPHLVRARSADYNPHQPPHTQRLRERRSSSTQRLQWRPGFLSLSKLRAKNIHATSCLRCRVLLAFPSVQRKLLESRIKMTTQQVPSLSDDCRMDFRKQHPHREPVVHIDFGMAGILGQDTTGGQGSWRRRISSDPTAGQGKLASVTAQLMSTTSISRNKQLISDCTQHSLLPSPQR